MDRAGVSVCSPSAELVFGKLKDDGRGEAGWVAFGDLVEMLGGEAEGGGDVEVEADGLTAEAVGSDAAFGGLTVHRGIGVEWVEGSGE